uniref:Phosphatidylinositol transfer protein N-terminal domain-containing protein n=1 Tax=Cairina moschata TaxID=8855 RepID=A0A8C3GGE3_CAIMO
MLVKEYRICMPLTTEEYRVGQLYTISKHSHQESEKGEGVEVVKNEPHEDPVHGPGQFTEKRVHLSSKLPSWARAVTPRIFYITEKAWNYYPYTITGETRGRGRPALRGQPCPGLTSPSLPPRCHPVMPACRGGPAEYTVRARGGPVPFQSCGWGEGAGVGVPRGPAPRRSPRSAPSCPSSPSTSRPNTRTTAGTARTSSTAIKSWATTRSPSWTSPSTRSPSATTAAWRTPGSSALPRRAGGRCGRAGASTPSPSCAPTSW